MNLRTFVALLRGGQIAVLPAVGRATRDYHRVAFLAAGLRSGWLQRLAAGPVPLDVLAADLQLAPEMREGLGAWLQTGVATGELSSGPRGYAVRGRLARRHWRLQISPAYDCGEVEVEAFNRGFPPKEKGYHTSQEIFAIAVRSFLR